MKNSHKIYLYFKSVLGYDKESGIFFDMTTGEPSETIYKDDHLYVQVDENRYRVDCLAWYYNYGEWPKYPLIHIDGINSNNKICNLKYLYVKKSFKHDGFTITGIKMENMTAWAVQISTNGKSRYVGYYKNFELAVIARYNVEVLHNYKPNTDAHNYVKQMFM